MLSRCTGWGGYARAGGIVGAKYNGKDGINITEIISCTNTGSVDANYYKGGAAGYRYKNPICGHDVKDVYDTF